MSIPRKNGTKRGTRTTIAREVQKKTGLSRTQSFRIAADIGDISQVKDITTAKLLKVKLECQRIARQLEIDEGKYVTRDSVREQGLALGAVVAACLDALVSSLPGQLEGLSAPAMSPIIEKEVQKARDAISDACRGL